MAKYYINKNAQPTGEHEVHTENCPHPPDPPNRDHLGEFDKCSKAVAAAKAKGYDPVDGCAYCVPDCHTR
jgi:hypothetical protein